MQNESLFTSQKRYRDDYYNFSPNMSIGGLKPIPPMFTNTPINNIPGYFMFNNPCVGNISNTGTPLLKPNERSTESLDFSAFKTDNISSPLQPDKSKVDCSNIVMVPTAGNNLGFYTWVINGSPYPNTVNNINIPSNMSKDSSKLKVKKKRFQEECSDY
jgi:hypothetical protein